MNGGRERGVSRSGLRDRLLAGCALATVYTAALTAKAEAPAEARAT